MIHGHNVIPVKLLLRAFLFYYVQILSGGKTAPFSIIGLPVFLGSKLAIRGIGDTPSLAVMYALFAYASPVWTIQGMSALTAFVGRHVLVLMGVITLAMSCS